MFRTYKIFKEVATLIDNYKTEESEFMRVMMNIQYGKLRNEAASLMMRNKIDKNRYNKFFGEPNLNGYFK